MNTPAKNQPEIYCVRKDEPAFLAFARTQQVEISKLSKRELHRLLGTFCAKKALSQQQDCSSWELKHGPNGEPLWPKGIVGSLSHSKEKAAALISNTEDARSVGIDIEFYSPTRKLNIAKRILNPSEQSLLPTSPEEQRKTLIALFSAKESIYKALNIITPSTLSFHSACCTAIHENEMLFALDLADIPSLLNIGYKWEEDYILTWVIVPH